MFALPPGGEAIAIGVIEIVKNAQAYEDKLFDALDETGKRKAAEIVLEDKSRWNEHARNAHGVLIGLVEWLASLRQLPKADVSGHVIDGP